MELEKIKRIIAGILNVNPEDVKADSVFTEDLGADSLDIFQIPASRIQVTDVCTCCNSGYLFSHRATQGKRGNLAAFLMMRD